MNADAAVHLLIGGALIVFFVVGGLGVMAFLTQDLSPQTTPKGKMFYYLGGLIVATSLGTVGLMVLRALGRLAGM